MPLDSIRGSQGVPAEAAAGAHPRPALEVEDLHVWYGEAIHALRGVSLKVTAGSLGANGAGKTTLQRAITGLLPYHGGAVRSGTVRLDGEVISRLAPAAIVKRHVSQVMEGRRIFADLTVAENLRAGGFTRRGKEELAAAYAQAMDLFPARGATADGGRLPVGGRATDGRDRPGPSSLWTQP